MNITLTSIAPLPDVLSQPGRNGTGRRHLIGHHDIDPGALRHFNDLIARIDLQHVPLERDQVASAARQLIDEPGDGLTPACIRQRMRRAAALHRMLTDPEWDTLAVASLAAAIVVDYLRDSANLIPNGLPVVGRLDDAVMVETGWPKAAEEVRNYMDFCRLRRIEAGLRGEKRPYFGFNRETWMRAHQAEADWIAHCHAVATNTYVPAAGNHRFRVS
jgi:hypothetical protein